MKRFLLLLTFSLGLLIIKPQLVNACENKECVKDDPNYVQCLSGNRSCLESKIAETKSQRITLTNTLNILNGQIGVQRLQIAQTQAEIKQLSAEIEVLSDRIKTLNFSLDKLTEMLIDRIVSGYKRRYISPFSILASKQSVGEMFARQHYIAQASQQTAEVMQRAESQRIEYDKQKNTKEAKQTEFEEKKAQLVREKSILDEKTLYQKKLIADTQNKESVYQQQLATTLAEYKAIQGIIAGRGTETKAGTVKQGERIASMITGASCNSNGTHLHFMVEKNGSVINPFSLLKSDVNYSNCSSWTCGGSDADPFNPTGNSNWPLREKIVFTQGYGTNTWAVRNRRVHYTFHNGIDIASESGNDVLSVADGTLYRGSYKYGCTLPYVKVVHDNDQYVTYYLHVNY